MMEEQSPFAGEISPDDKHDATMPPGFTIAMNNAEQPTNQGDLTGFQAFMPQEFFETDLEKQIMNKLALYDEHKVPPDIEESWLHAECNKVGKPITECTVSEIKICPCCYNIENEQYSVCTSTNEIMSMGPVIPMFFHLNKYLMILAFIICIGTGISEYYIVIGNCAVEPKTKCGATLATLIDAGNRPKTYIQASLIPILMFIVIVAFLIFHRTQRNLRQEIDQNSISPADYSAMLYEIGPAEQSREYIESYIGQLLFHNDLPPIQIKKISIGKFEGNLDRIQGIIESTRGSIEALKKAAKIKGVTEQIKEKIERKIMAQDDRLKHYKKKLEIYRLKVDKEEVLKYNSIAFVSFNTQAQAECVFQLETQKMKFRWILYKIFPCFLKKRGHYIQQAPEPDDIKWKFIGYSSFQRFWSIFVSYLMTIILILLSFGIQVHLRILQSSIAPSSGGSASTARKASVLVHVVQWISAVLVAVMNSVIVMLALRLSKYERHLSHSMFVLHHSRKLIVLQFVNSAAIAVCLTLLP
jgi:Cytosolic domain of 10TM putative phosphate transporter/Calcium-activated chloride channel